jgi:hypothetical protein
MIISRKLLPHMIAGGLALGYAWLISGTRFVTTGVQFVSPLAVIVLIHVLWSIAQGRVQPGFARSVYRRSILTSIGIVVGTALFAVFAPLPATASTVSETLGVVVATIACLAVLALVVLAAAAVVGSIGYGFHRLFRLIRTLWQRKSGGPPGPGPTHLQDAGGLALVLSIIGVASLEGLPGAYSFLVADRASSSLEVAAPPDRVWREVGKATSPAFPLPVMLKSIPQPVAVLVDEGAALGARRVVRFRGREGEGDLALQVSRRTETEAVFQAVSDTSPVANWVRHESLTFRVEPSGVGSRLTVVSDYDRLLSPAWFFRPYIRLASYLAVNVLARDTKQRAEGTP